MPVQIIPSSPRKKNQATRRKANESVMISFELAFELRDICNAAGKPDLAKQLGKEIGLAIGKPRITKAEVAKAFQKISESGLGHLVDEVLPKGPPPSRKGRG
jgi:hypothetical protein